MRLSTQNKPAGHCRHDAEQCRVQGPGNSLQHTGRLTGPGSSHCSNNSCAWQPCTPSMGTPLHKSGPPIEAGCAE